MLSTRVAPAGYWWRGRPNFGDLLTPLLLAHFADLQVVWAPVAEASFVCVGSVLEHLPQGWSGTILGSGKLKAESQIDLSRARVLALRGPLTAQCVKGVRRGFVLGDAGLLADELVPVVEKKHALGLVPHWSDTTLEHRPEFQRYAPVVIRPSEDPLEVIRKIGECRKIISSSLHGIIVADAFGIPRRIEMTERFAKEGGDFKFRDHCAAVGVPFQVGVTQEPSRYKVQDRQHELFDVLEEFGRQVAGLAR